MSVLLIALGCLPFVFGGLLNGYMMQHMDKTPPFLLINLLFIALWFAIAICFRPHMESTGKTVRWLNLVPFVVLVVLAVQELIVGAYWPNVVGQYTQYFYLPMLFLGFRLTAWVGSVFMAYVASFGLMVAVSVLACRCWEK